LRQSITTSRWIYPTLPGVSPLMPSHKNPTNPTIVPVFGVGKAFVVVGFRI
jgi:hypothetical protein